MKKTFKFYILLAIIGISSINIFVQADYDKPVAPTELKSDIIKSANTILDSVYNKRTNKTKFPTLESYIVYIDKVNDKLKILKNTFSTSDFRYVLISYLSTGLSNIKTSVQNEIMLNSIVEATNDNSNTCSTTNTGIIQTNLDSVVTLTGNQTIDGIKTFSSPIVAPNPTANNQLVTKAYMDNTISTLGNSGGGGTCDGTFLYMKYTEGMYTGDLGGKSGADEKCNLEYPGYHICSMKTISKAGRMGCLQHQTYSNLSSSIYGRVDHTDNCNNWTYEGGGDQSYNGFYFGVGFQMLTSWIYRATDCGGELRLLCCK